MGSQRFPFRIIGHGIRKPMKTELDEEMFVIFYEHSLAYFSLGL
jgi:hypothetical protein